MRSSVHQRAPGCANIFGTRGTESLLVADSVAERTVDPHTMAESIRVEGIETAIEEGSDADVDDLVDGIRRLREKNRPPTPIGRGCGPQERARADSTDFQNRET